MTNEKTGDARLIALTGASRGIGAAIAAELSRRGFAVACLSRNGIVPAPGDGDQAGTAGPLHGVVCDVGDRASVEAAFAEIAALPGELYGVVNCAGIIYGGRSSEFDLGQLEETLKTNVVGTFSVCQVAYPALKRNGGGLIVNIGSFWDQMGVKWYAAYAASKAGVAALTRCFGAEWARDGIRVVDVAPGYITTDMNKDYLATEETRNFIKGRVPVGRPGTTDEVARVVAALFQENVEFLTATTIYVDGGQGTAQ